MPNPRTPIPYLSMLLLGLGHPNVFTYFHQSNLAGKVIVLCLIVFSLLAWTVMIGKYIEIRKIREINRHLEKRLAAVGSVLQIEKGLWQMARGPYAELMRAGVEAFCRSESDSTTTSARIHHVENALQRGVAETSIRYESKMVLLGSIVTGAPFLGLLGTVWGVMDAFGSVALESTASIQMLAPGVSGALLTTVAGLLVAIPSVFGYNFLLTQTKIAITEVENFASSLADRIEIEASDLN